MDKTALRDILIQADEAMYILDDMHAMCDQIGDPCASKDIVTIDQLRMSVRGLGRLGVLAQDALNELDGIIVSVERRGSNA